MSTTPKLDSFLARVAAAYDAAVHCHHAIRPAFEQSRHENGEVSSRYGSLCRELMTQYRTLEEMGIRFTFVDVDPYRDSAAMFADLDKRVLRVYRGGDIPADHPFTRVAFGDPGYPQFATTFNHVFRAVHDTLAHYSGRNGFGKVGEFRAFRAHARTLTLAATHALFTETVAQNAWYHFVGNGNTFAPQKATLLPLELVTEALSLEV